MEGAGAKSNCGWPSSTGQAVAGTGRRRDGVRRRGDGGRRGWRQKGHELTLHMFIPEAGDLEGRRTGTSRESVGLGSPPEWGRGAEERGHRGPGSADPCMLKYLR